MFPSPSRPRRRGISSRHLHPARAPRPPRGAPGMGEPPPIPTPHPRVGAGQGGGAAPVVLVAPRSFLGGAPAGWKRAAGARQFWGASTPALSWGGCPRAGGGAGAFGVHSPPSPASSTPSTPSTHGAPFAQQGAASPHAATPRPPLWLPPTPACSRGWSITPGCHLPAEPPHPRRTSAACCLLGTRARPPRFLPWLPHVTRQEFQSHPHLRLCPADVIGAPSPAGSRSAPAPGGTEPGEPRRALRQALGKRRRPAVFVQLRGHH